MAPRTLHKIHSRVLFVLLSAGLSLHAQAIPGGSPDSTIQQQPSAVPSEQSGEPHSTPPQAPPTFELSTVTENPILGPNFGGIGNPQCDGSGNVYINETLLSTSEKSILRLSSDGKQSKLLLFPSDLRKNYLSAFYVDPGGTLYGLLTSPDTPPAYTLIEISSAGNELRRTALQLPDNLFSSEFAVLPDAKIMVRGSLALPPDPAPKGTIPVVHSFLYMAWLDANGQRVHDTGSDPKGHETYDVSNHSDFAAITPGPPGTFLTVAGTSLNTYDSSGTLLHSNPIVKPEKDAIASTIQYLDGQAEIKFQVPHEVDVYPPAPEDGPHPLTPNPNPPKQQKVTTVRQVWLFADPVTGTMHGFYEFPNFAGSGDCYLGNQNFLYTTVKAEGPVFVEAHPK